MKLSKQSIKERIETAIRLFETLRPEATIGGMTLAQFKNALKASLDTRALIEELDTQRAGQQQERDLADEASLAVLKRFAAAIKADPAEGEDSELLEAMGYVTARLRKSGLTRKKNGNGTTPPQN